MSRRSAALSRTLSGLLSGALILTTLQLAAAPASAVSEPDRDPAALLEAAVESPAAPPGPLDGAPDGATIATGQSVDTSSATSEVVADGAILRGAVQNMDDAPLAGITVTAYGYSDDQPESPVAMRQVVSGADGRWEISGIDEVADRWIVEFVDPQERYATQFWQRATEFRAPVPIELGDGAVVEGIDAVMQLVSTITGRMTGLPAGLVALDQYVWLHVFDWDRWEWVNVAEAEVAADGTFSFSGLGPDYYVVRGFAVTERGVGLAPSGVVLVNEGQEQRVDIRLERAVDGPNRDFSGDWRDDVLAINSTGKLLMYAGNGNGGWAAPGDQVGFGWNTLDIVFPVGDFSNDGYTDLIGRSTAGDLWLYRGNGNRGWAGSVNLGPGWGGFTSLFAPGDFNGDGFVDVMARDRAGALLLYPGNGVGGFRDRPRVIGSGWQGFTALIGPGDFDGDQHVDVLARDSAGRLWLYPGNGSGGWLPKRQVGSGWQGFTAIAGAGDFSGDGAPDLIARDSSGRLFLYRGDGQGGWRGSTLIGSGWNGLRLAN